MAFQFLFSPQNIIVQEDDMGIVSYDIYLLDWVPLSSTSDGSKLIIWFGKARLDEITANEIKIRFKFWQLVIIELVEESQNSSGLSIFSGYCVSSVLRL